MVNSNIVSMMEMAISDYEIDKILISAHYGELSAKEEADFLEWFITNEDNIQWEDGSCDYYNMFCAWKAEVKSLDN